MKHRFTRRVSKVTAEQLESYHRFPNTVPAAFAGGKLQDSKKEEEVMSMRSFAKIWQPVKKVEPCLEDSPDKLEKELLMQTLCPTLIVFQKFQMSPSVTQIFIMCYKKC